MNPRTTISAQIHPEVLAEIKTRAQEAGVTVSAWLAEALTLGLATGLRPLPVRRGRPRKDNVKEVRS